MVTRVLKCLSLTLPLLACTASAPVLADGPRHAQGVFCDTAEQITQFLDKWEGHDPNPAMKEVNTAAKKDNACIFADVLLFASEPDAKAIPSKTGEWHLVRVVIVAMRTPTGAVVQTSPIPQYTATPEAPAAVKGSSA